MKSCCREYLPASDKPSLGRQLLISPFLLLIKIYQWVISPMLGPKCRFTPTCSQYAVKALKKHGLFKGSWLAARRLASCHPWGRSGYDPVP